MGIRGLYMKENLYMLKKWWAFTRPSKKWFCMSLLSSFCYRICVVLEPIFSAKVITSLTVSEYKMAMIYLLCGVLLYALRNACIHPKYMIHSRLIASSYTRMQCEIIDKMFVAQKENFKLNSANKLLNIYHNDVYTTSTFADVMTDKWGRLLQVLIMVCIVASANVWAALVIIFMIYINSLIISVLQTKYAKGTKLLRESIDNQYADFAKILESKDYINSDKVKNVLKERAIEDSKKFVKEFKSRQNWASAINNWYYVWCNIFIFIVTVFMVILVSKGSLSLEMYLIVVPYISSCITISNEFLVIFTELKNTIVSMNRVKTVCDFTERDAIRFGKNNYDDILGTIDFINVYYTRKPSDENRNTIKDINFHIKDGDSALILGARNSGKRTIFEMLARTLDSDSGHIYIDGIEIDDYSKKSYTKNISFCTSKPYFIENTIYKELSLIKSNRKKINQALEKVGLLEYLSKTKEKLNTPIDSLSSKNKFLLGLARCLLAETRVVIVYEIPSNISQEDKQDIYRVLHELFGEKTIIIFSAMSDLANVCNKIIEIENGEIVHITFNDNNTKKELYNV